MQTETTTTTLNAPGRTRRPIGHKVEPDGPEPETNARTWLFREDAQAAADELERRGWRADVQYVGAWMRWTVEANRKSWPIGRFVVLLKDGSLGKPEDL